MAAWMPDAALLARLISFPSVSRESNLPIADFICNYLDDRALEIVRQPSPDGAKTNLLIRTRNAQGADGQGLMLCGHMDVVPAQEPDWRSDPFTRLVGADWQKLHWFATERERDDALADMAARHAYSRRGDEPAVIYEKVSEGAAR